MREGGQQRGFSYTAKSDVEEGGEIRAFQIEKMKAPQNPVATEPPKEKKEKIVENTIDAEASRVSLFS